MERLEMLENETIIELANRMLAKRQETGNEVESSIYGITVSTENCQKPEDIELQLLKTRIETYDRNAEEAEHNYLMAAFAEQYQKREKGPSFPILVLSPQAEEVQRKEQDKQKEASNQFYLDFQTKNDIDWNNSDEVYGWMATIIDDLNNFDARLPLNEIYSEEELSQLQQKYQTEHLSSAQVVLDELKKHDYTGEKIEIHSKDDFNRQYIANYINELEKYGMLLTEKYVDVLKDGGKEAEEEIINVVYRQAQDVLENSQDKNIDQVAFDEQKMKIAEEVSDVARRREKINFILDVAKAAPSLELIANATTAVQVSTDIKKENLETKLATIVKNSTNLLNNEQTPETPVMEAPDLAKEVQDYLSYEEDYKAKMNKIYSSVTEDVEQLIEALYQKESQQAKRNTQVAASEEYNKVLQKIKTNAQKTKESLDSLPSGLMPIIDTNEILKLKPSGQINTNDETWAIQNFYKVNRGEATEADIQKTNELIEKIPDSPYYQPLKDAMEKWEPYYTEKYHPEIIAQRLDDAKKPTIDTSEILKLKPSGQINTNDETWAIQNFYKVNRGEATEADIQRTNELIEKIPDSPYYQPLKDAMEKWGSYYNEKYNPRNEKNKLEQKTAIYNQILDLNKDNKLSDKEKLSNLLSDARNKNIFTTEELKNFEELLVQGSKELSPTQLPNQADKTKEDRLQNLENKKQELNELVKGQAGKEEVEAKLREIAKPILENLDRQIKNLEFNLNNIKSSDADLVNKIIAEWQRKAPNNIDKSKITAEAITQALNKQLQSKLKEKQDLEQKISDFVQLHEKIKNKDYPGLKKDDPKKDEPPKNILTLDDEEVEGLTNPSNKLRDKINRLKNKGVVKTILGWIKEHPVKAVALLATTGIIGVVAVAGIGSLMGNKVAEVEKPTKEVSQEADDGLIAQSPIADTVDEAIQQATNEAPTVDNNSIANQVLADEQARIATGSDAVYQDVHSAASEQNKQYAQSSDVQSIWQNATVEAGKMYQVEANGALTELNGVDALVQAGNEGKTIISTWQNEDGTLGRSVITPSEFGQSMENAEESAKTR